MTSVPLARREFLAASTTLGIAACLDGETSGHDQSTTALNAKQYEAAVTKGIDFLRIKGQAMIGILGGAHRR